MSGYVQVDLARRTNNSFDPGRAAGRSTNSGVTSRDAVFAGDIALGDPMDRRPHVQSLLQMRRTLDRSPRVQSQIALQRALNGRPQSDLDDEEPLQRKPGSVPTLQMTSAAIDDDWRPERKANGLGARANGPMSMPSFSAAHFERPLLHVVGAHGVQTRPATIQRMIHKGHKRGRRVVVNDDKNPHHGKQGIILAPYQQDDSERRVGHYNVQLPGVGVVDLDFHQLNLTPSGTKIASFLESDVPSDTEEAREEPWTVTEARGLELVAANLVRHYPPDQFAYIPIGNSPALVMEFIRQESGTHKWKSALPPPTILPLPMSKVGAESYVEFMQDEARQSNMDRYLSGFISPDKLEGKKPLLIDYSSGQSLRIVALHVRNYLKSAVSVVNLRSGGDIQPDEGLGEIKDLVIYAKDKELTGKNLEAYREQARRFGPLASVDPGRHATAFLEGLVDRRWKTNFGYKVWNDVIYEDILRGGADVAADEEGVGRVARDVELIRAALELPENR